MQPRVSVVIPTYNAPELLMETLQTVFAQTRAADEVIIINDGSTDDTVARLQPLVEIGKIRVITQPNQGIGAARNRGLHEATGDFISLLDHDDLWHPEKLAEQVTYLESRPDLDAATCCWEYNITPGKCVYDKNSLAGKCGTVEHPFKAFADRQQFVITSAMMIRRKAARSIQYCETRGGIEDVSFYMLFFQEFKMGIAGEKILMTYRLHESNASKKASYFDIGIRELRKMDAQGMFSKLQPDDRMQMLEYFAAIGRIAVAYHLVAGARLSALHVYFSEYCYQSSSNAWRFLIGFWLCLPMPSFVSQKLLRLRSAF